MAPVNILLYVTASCISTVLNLTRFLSVAHIWGHETHTGASFNSPPTSIRCLKRFLNGKKGGDPSLFKLTYVSITTSRNTLSGVRW